MTTFTSPSVGDDARLDCRINEHTATITITNPHKRNAMTPAMWRDLPPLLDDLATDPAVRILVLTGYGDTFSAGADITALTDLLDTTGTLGPAGDHSLAGLAEQALAAFPKPTIAAIRGFCIGGGVQLAATCDLRLATDTARFGITPAKIGIIYPCTATARLVQLIGPAHARKLLYTADLIDAPTAHHIGLIDTPVPAADLDRHLTELTTTLAARSQLTLQATKDIIATLTETATYPLIHRHHIWHDQVLTTDEATEGITAFLQRRPPTFTWTRPPAPWPRDDREDRA